MFRTAKRLLLLVTAFVPLSYVGVSAYLWDTQRQHIFEPGMLIQTTPDRVGLKYEEVHIPVGNGSERGELYGWWIPAHPHTPTLLYLHGNDKNISNSRDVENAGRLHDMDYNVLMVDYRGHGKSTGGEPSEAKVYEDAEAAWNYLIKQRANAPQRTFIYGHSLGGAIAIDLAIHHPEAAGLIAESTFTTMSEMGEREYHHIFVDWLLNQRFDSLGKISGLKVPVLFIHGTWDRIVPYQMSQRLFDRAPQPKFLTLIDGGEHNNSSSVGWTEYRSAFTSFVQRYAH